LVEVKKSGRLSNHLSQVSWLDQVAESKVVVKIK